MRQSLSCSLCIVELQERDCKLQRTKTSSVSSQCAPTSAHTFAPDYDLLSVLFKFIMPKGTPASIDISDLILNGLNCVLRYP